MAGQSSRTLCLGLLGWLLADWGQAPPAQAQDLGMYQPAFQYHSPLPALPPRPPSLCGVWVSYAPRLEAPP